jgi:hypothetical protein
LGPVKNPTINTSSLFPDQASATATPTIAWDAPDLGNPNAYMVTIYQLDESLGTTLCTQQSRLFLPGTMTSVTLPSGILVPTMSYAILITAYVDSSYDPTTAPWAAHKFPYGMSESLSGVITIALP